MKTPKLIAAVQLIEEHKWSELDRFILLRYTERSDTYDLFRYIRKHRSQLQTLSLQQIVEEQFPHMQVKAVSNLMSRLLPVVEDYLVYQHVTSEQLVRDTTLAKIYNRSGRYKLANQKVSKVEKALLANKTTTLEKNQLLHNLYYYQYYSYNAIKYKEKGRLLDKLVTTAGQVMADRFALYELEVINRGRVVDYDFSHHQGVFGLDILTDNTDLFVSLRALVQEESEEAFWRLVEGMQTFEDPAADDLQRLVALYVIKYSLILWSKGRLDKAHIVGQVHDYGLEKGLFLTDGKLTGLKFLNVATSLLPVQSKADSVDFIHKWADRVDIKDKEALKDLALSQAYLYYEDFEKSLQHIRYVRFESAGFKCRSYACHMIVLYELRAQDYSAVRGAMRRFGRYLFVNKEHFEARMHRSMLNLTKFINQLLLYEIKEVDVQVGNYLPIAYRAWAEKAADRVK